MLLLSAGMECRAQCRQPAGVIARHQYFRRYAGSMRTTVTLDDKVALNDAIREVAAQHAAPQLFRTVPLIWVFLRSTSTVHCRSRPIWKTRS